MSTREQFWRLSSPDSMHGLYAPAEWTDDVDLVQVRCPLTGSHDRAGARVGNLRVRLGYSKAPDFVWTWHNELMVQQHVLESFQAAGLTGFEVRPVEEVRFAGRPREPREPPRLWELVVTGWGGEASPESGITMQYYCEACHRAKYTDPNHPELMIDPSQWDGSDLFVIWPLPRFIFVTERVVDLIRNEGYKGLKTETPGDLFKDQHVIAAISVGWLPPGHSVRGPEAYPGAKVRRWDGVPRRPAWVLRGEEPPDKGEKRR